MSTVLERMMRLFAGYAKHHGRFAIKPEHGQTKTKGQAWTSTGPATAEVWEQHLTARGAGLGVIPLREDDTCLFAAIDVDKYNLDLKAVETSIGDLPLVVCRSKSGGAHLYLFLAEPVPAREVIQVLTRLAAALGFGGSEIFPKQSVRASDRDIGNWINLPYYDFEKTVRYGYAGGRSLEIEEFLDEAERKRVTYDELLRLEAPAVREVDDDLFKDGPPCLQRIAALGGLVPGTQNDGLMAVTTYLKRRWPDHWRDKLQAYNNALCDPPHELTRLLGLQKNHEKKDYEYRCNLPPLKAYCDRRTCLQREFGVGGGRSGPGEIEITSMTKYEGEPTLWGIELGPEVRVMVDTDTLYSQARFNKLCMDTVSRCPGTMPPGRWFKYLDDKLKEADVVPSPEDASPEGQFWLLFDAFATGRVQARRQDELLLDKPFREGGFVLFKSSALFKYLDEHRYRIPTHHQVWQWMRERGAEKKGINIKGKYINVWRIADPGGPTVAEAPPARDEEVF